MVGPYCVVSPLLLAIIIVPHRQLSSYHLIHERGVIRRVWCALYCNAQYRQAVRLAVAPSNPGSATAYSGNYVGQGQANVPPASQQSHPISQAHSKLYQIHRHQLSRTVQASLQEQYQISHMIRHHAGAMSDIGICTRASRLCASRFACQRWRCMRVARIARIMNWTTCNMSLYE